MVSFIFECGRPALGRRHGPEQSHATAADYHARMLLTAIASCVYKHSLFHCIKCFRQRKRYACCVVHCRFVSFCKQQCNIGQLLDLSLLNNAYKNRVIASASVHPSIPNSRPLLTQCRERRRIIIIIITISLYFHQVLPINAHATAPPPICQTPLCSPGRANQKVSQGPLLPRSSYSCQADGPVPRAAKPQALPGCCTGRSHYARPGLAARSPGVWRAPTEARKARQDSSEAGDDGAGAGVVCVVVVRGGRGETRSMSLSGVSRSIDVPISRHDTPPGLSGSFLDSW